MRDRLREVLAGYEPQGIEKDDSLWPAAVLVLVYEHHGRHHVVFQINEDDSRKWNTVLVNINNVQEELGSVDVAVVVIGPALGMLKADALTANRVQDAISAGVRFVACGNSMTAQHLTKDDMIDGIDYAKAGYVELMRLQQAGWTYLRP